MPAPAVQSSVDRVLASGVEYRFREWYYEDVNHPGGIFVDGSIVPVLDADGRVVGVRTISVDVTDKVRARQAVEEQKGLVEEQRALLETILDAAPVGLACFDCEMQPVSANAEYARICGMNPDEAITGEADALLPAAWAGPSCGWSWAAAASTRSRSAARRRRLGNSRPTIAPFRPNGRRRPGRSACEVLRQPERRL